MSNRKRQFSISTALCVVACLGIYLALARVYGFGRAILCLAVVAQAASSILFFVAAYHCAKEDNLRNTAAALLLGLMILAGSFFLALAVFRVPPTKPALLMGHVISVERFEPNASKFGKVPSF